MTFALDQVARYKNDRRGTFSIYLAIVFMIILMVVGCAVDMAQLTGQRARLNDLADSTALAAAIATREDKKTRMKTAKNYYTSSRNGLEYLVLDKHADIKFDDDTKDVTVKISGVHQFMFMGMFGFSDPVLESSATVGYMIDDLAPISIAFAFDTSGSMGWASAGGDIKIKELEKSTKTLFEELYDASELPKLLEEKMTTAFSSYNRNLVESEGFSEGHKHIEDAVGDMVPNGGTNSTPSLVYALNSLNAEKARINQPGWRGFVVFMTDGDNNLLDASGNPVTWDADSQIVCDAIKTEGYEVYTIAFEAPLKGQALLSYCASTSGHYFDSKNAQDLRKAFKLIGRKLGSSTIRIKS